MGLSAQSLESEPSQLLARYFDSMLRKLGPQDWWPARTRFEIIVGAVLTQNTSWRNVVLALRGMRQKRLLDPARLERASLAEIEVCIRPAGFYRQKSRTLRRLLVWLESHCGASLAKMFSRPPQELRRELLEIKGLGPETVDAILLYAGGHPIFVADAYTRRILERHGLVPSGAKYAMVQEFLHNNLAADPRLFNEYHALLVEIGKRYCKRPAPLCDECPLKDFLTGPSAREIIRESRTVHERQCEPVRPRTKAVRTVPETRSIG
jgi:endonuclease III related protein